jgi:hypothetical protein
LAPYAAPVPRPGAGADRRTRTRCAYRSVVDQDCGRRAPVRVTTAFNRLLDLPGTRVTAVSFTASMVAVTVRLRRRRLARPHCELRQWPPGCVD